MTKKTKGKGKKTMCSSNMKDEKNQCGETL